MEYFLHEKRHSDVAGDAQMIEPEQYFFHFTKTPYKEKRPGVLLKTITGYRSQLCPIELAPAAEARHVHDHEQIGYILCGKVILTIGNNAESLSAGDGYRIPANVEHGFAVSSESKLEYIEIFCPPKEENVL